MDGLVTGMDEKEWMGEVNEVSEEIKNTIPAVSTVGETPTAEVSMVGVSPTIHVPIRQ